MMRANRFTGALLAVAGIVTATAGGSMPATVEMLAAALLLLGSAATLGGLHMLSEALS